MCYNFEMNRLCVFAHWDKDNIVDDYVVYYLKALKEVANTIIFVSDCNLSAAEKSKLDGIVTFLLAEKHGEYDFGSYKRGFLYAKEHNISFDELIFANDSVYGPFYPLKLIFDKMSKKKCDFWGMTKNNYGLNEKSLKLIREPHIQSYFLVFHENVYNSNIFINFINSISKQYSKSDVITKYEIGLSKTLYQNNFKSCAYINRYGSISNCTIFKWDKLILKYNFPFLKTSIIKKGFDFTGAVKGWEEIIEKKSDYPIEYIKKNFDRLSDLYEDKYSQLNLYRKVRYDILKHFPVEVRYVVIFLEKAAFNILNTICFNKLQKF